MHTLTSTRGPSARFRALAGSRTRRERGSIVATAVLAVPVILLLFTIVQAWLYYAANNTAKSAAQAGLQAARVETGSAGAGRMAALDNARTLGGINNLTVTSTRGGQTAQVTVTGRAPSVVPFLTLPQIRAEASGAIERVTP